MTSRSEKALHTAEQLELECFEHSSSHFPLLPQAVENFLYGAQEAQQAGCTADDSELDELIVIFD